MIWLVCLPACIPCGFGAFNQLFMQQIPDHWCKIPELNNLSIHQRRHLGIPLTVSWNFSSFNQINKHFGFELRFFQFQIGQYNL